MTHCSFGDCGRHQHYNCECRALFKAGLASVPHSLNSGGLAQDKAEGPAGLSSPPTLKTETQASNQHQLTFHWQERSSTGYWHPLKLGYVIMAKLKMSESIYKCCFPDDCLTFLCWGFFMENCSKKGFRSTLLIFSLTQAGVGGVCMQGSPPIVLD